jgi:hypothetical protein
MNPIIDLPPDAARPLAVLPEEPDLTIDPQGQVIENADGSADILDPVEDMKDGSDFYSNLVETLPEQELHDLAADLLEKIELDKESRKKRDEQYEDGLRRTGLGNDAPGGAQFEGASRVVHPLLAEACIDFSARTMKELFPPRGPVRTHVPGKGDKEKLAKAEVKASALNWQLMTQMREYREEMEQLTTQEPMGGSQYIKFWHDSDARRHRCEFVPIDMLLLPYAASGLYSSERVTHVQDITRYTFDQRVASGLYRDIDDETDPGFPEKTKAQSANDKIEGREEDPYNEDGLRRVFEVTVYHQFEKDKRTLPYVVHLDEYSEEVLGVYRNWEEEDTRCTKLEWLVEFKFIPWRGAYGIGLPHLIGGIAGALTGALRALLDSAHIQNAATMLKLKGIRGSGENTQVEVTQVCEIEAPPQVDDIRKVAMPMPFNPPSPVLLQLLGILTDVGKGVVATAEEKIADVSDRMPVGTAMALIEQGSQVYASIHSRHHFAQQRALEIVCRLNRMYPEALEEVSEALGEEVSPELFSDLSGIEPVSDPNIFSETQRYAQIQAVSQVLANPALQGKVNNVALARITLQRLKFDQADEVLPEDPEPQNTDPVTENVFATKGLPILAFMEQDHVAHMITHLTFCASPIFGANPLMTVPTVPGLLAHCKEHLAMFYSLHAKASVAAMAEIHQMTGGAGDSAEAIKHAIALADREIATQLAPIMPMFQQAQQLSMAAAPKPPMDPGSQVALELGKAEIDRKTKMDQATLQMTGAEKQAKAAAEQAKQQMDASIKQAEMQRLADEQRFQQFIEQQTAQQAHSREQLMQQVELMKNDADNRQHQETEIRKNDQDNMSAILIERMKEGLVQSQASAPQQSPVSVSLGDTMGPLIQAMSQQFEKLSSGQTALSDAVLGLHKLHSAPKMIIKDPLTGKPIGIRSQLD